MCRKLRPAAPRHRCPAGIRRQLQRGGSRCCNNDSRRSTICGRQRPAVGGSTAAGRLCSTHSTRGKRLMSGAGEWVLTVLARPPPPKEETERFSWRFLAVLVLEQKIFFRHSLPTPSRTAAIIYVYIAAVRGGVAGRNIEYRRMPARPSSEQSSSLAWSSGLAVVRTVLLSGLVSGLVVLHSAECIFVSSFNNPTQLHAGLPQKSVLEPRSTADSSSTTRRLLLHFFRWGV